MNELNLKEKVKHRIASHKGDERFQHELKEMQETQDLREVDDDVEEIATLYEWEALEHPDHPRSPKWYVVLAVAGTALVVWFLFRGNFIAAITTAFVTGFIYYIAQKVPPITRYRIMVDGVAINNTLYHFRDIEGFNVVYEPGETKTVLFKSKRKFSPLISTEIGDADPVAIREILLEFLKEDQELDEPLIDVWSRRVGF